MKARLTATWRRSRSGFEEERQSSSTRAAVAAGPRSIARLMAARRQTRRQVLERRCNATTSPSRWVGASKREGVACEQLLHSAGKMSNVRWYVLGLFTTATPSRCFARRWRSTQGCWTLLGRRAPFVAYRLNGKPIPLEQAGLCEYVPGPTASSQSNGSGTSRCQRLPRPTTHTALQNSDPGTSEDRNTIDDRASPVSPPGGGRCDRGHRDGRLARPRSGGTGSGESGTHGKIGDDDPRKLSRMARLNPGLGRLECGIAPDDQAKPGVGPSAQIRQPKGGHTFSIALWSATLAGLQTGGYEFRVRTVDKNG